MDEKKKKQYTILGIFFAVLFIIIIAIPDPKSKRKINIPQPISPNSTNINIETIPKTNEKNISYDDEKGGYIVEEYFNRKVKRDIFKNPILRETNENFIPEQKQITNLEEPKKSIKEFKVSGVMITDKKKTITLDDGRILEEKEVVDGYVISNISRNEVIFISKDGKDIRRVKIWEE